MENTKIIGLPVLISARCRIVLDQSLRALCGIPENGPVWAQIGSDTISVYPANQQHPQAAMKQVTIGRFNLPMLWVQRNHAAIGGYVFLAATENHLQIRIDSWTLQQCQQDHILGIPIKIYQGNLIYISKTYWLHYGIEPYHGCVAREEQDGRLIFRSRLPEEVPDVGTPLYVHNSVNIRPAWMKKNGLHIGDKLWLYGTSDGPAVSVHPVCDENFYSEDCC